MGVFQETVPKWIYDQKCAEYDRLFLAYEKLRPTHSPVAPMRITPPPGEPGMATLHAVEAAVDDPKVARIADSLIAQKPGLARDAALREAKRLNDIARGRAVVESQPPAEPPR